MIKQQKLYLVHGRVQGVGFRRFAQRCANEYSVGGWVKNRPDGDVEIKAIGSSVQLDSFIQKISAGSWFSDVEEVEEIASGEIDSNDTDFRIIR